MSAETSKKPAKVGMIETFLSGGEKGLGNRHQHHYACDGSGLCTGTGLQCNRRYGCTGQYLRTDHGVFGLPGEAITVLISAFFAKAAGAATAFNLYQTGVITAAQATICVMPSMLMGTLVGHYARIVLVTETNKKYTLLMFLIPLFDAALGMILMRLILTAMGLM